MLVTVPALLLLAVLAAVPLARWLGARAGYPLAAFPVAAFALLIPLIGPAMHEPFGVAWTWIPQLGAEWSLHLDALGLVFALTILAVGALVLLYAPRYLEHGEVGPALFYGGMTGFAAAMTLLVLAGDALTLYVGWEGTTITSYLLIASAPKGGRAAVIALLVTFGGGLALLGAALLAAAELGSLSLAAMGDPARWAGAPVGVFLGLLVVAAAAKSGQWPFHFWLPAAMVAPTPVSAYLHAAAMVTAGLYLLLRFAALIASQPVIGDVVAVLGAATALFASTAALRKDDLKELLAFSTIAHLGFMVSLVGIGTAAAVAGALVYFLAHAGYKGGLFLVAGIYDHALGTRSLSSIRGKAAQARIAAICAGLACFSMAGVAPALGYLGKEEAFKGLLHHPGPLQIAVTAGLVIALVLTVVYTLRIACAPFSGMAGARGAPSEERPYWPMLIAPGLLGIITAAGGLFAGTLDPLIHAAAVVALGHGPSSPLALWHGMTPAFVLSLVTLAAGIAIYPLRGRLIALRGLPQGLAERLAERGARSVRARTGLEWALSHPAPALHSGIVAVAAAAAVAAGLLQAPGGGEDFARDSAVRWGVCLLLAAAAFTVARTRDRLAGFATVAAVGFLVAVWYVLHGAPQLAAVQLVIDVLSLALALFVLRALSRDAPAAGPVRQTGTAAIALAGGAAFAALSLVQASSTLPPASGAYLESARSSGTGNLVSAILAEYRGLDTLGEVTVVAAAAIGVVAVLRKREEQWTRSSPE